MTSPGKSRSQTDAEAPLSRLARWFRRCPHDAIRCVHGDEIIDRNGARRACLDCGRSLKGSLPDLCAVTGRLHPSVVADRPLARLMRGQDSGHEGDGTAWMPEAAGPESALSQTDTVFLWHENPCCERPDLGPLATGADGAVIAGARICKSCGKTVMVVVNGDAPPEQDHGA